jgi:hypothetical protein
MGKAHQIKKTTVKPKSEKMHWLLGRRSTLSIESKLLLYKAVLKPMEFSYGGKPLIQIRESSSAFNPRLSDLF